MMTIPFIKFASISIASILMFGELSFAARTIERGPVRPIRDPGGVRALFSHDANNVRMAISNWGEYGNPNGVPGFFGFEFPLGSGTDFLFSSGIWVGAIVDGERLVSTGTDGDNGTREFSPSIDRFIYQSHLISRAPYRFSLIAFDDDSDWNIETDDWDENGEPSPDWDGPDEDANGDGILFYDPEPHIDEDPPGDMANDLIDNDYDGMIDDADDDLDGDAAPGEDDDDGDGESDEDGAAMAAQDITAFYDDTDVREVRRPDPDGHTPLNIMIEQRSYSWNIIDPHVLDAVVFEAKIRNIGEETINNMYYALFVDADIAAEGEAGDPASTDDWIMYVPELMMAVTGDDTTDDDGWGPGILGVKILRTPVPLEELGISFKSFNRMAGGDPELNGDKYNMIASGDIDPPSNRLSDWRFLLGFGPQEDDDPWELEPQESMALAYAFIGADDLPSLRETAAAIQEFYDVGRENIFRGEFMSVPTRPEVFDVGDGESLLVSWERYHQLPLVGGAILHFGDLVEWDEQVDVGEDIERVVDGLEEGTPYYFAISLYDTDGEEGPVSDTTWLAPLSVPRKPANLWVEAELYHAIQVKWQPNPHHELDLAGYNLYRSADDGEFSRVNEAPLEAVTYVDSLHEFAVYTYRITAADEDGNESVAYGADSLDAPAVGAPFILEEGRILLLDETRDGNGRPGSPNDRQSDDFYRAILQDFQFDELDYREFYDAAQRPLETSEIGPYGIIIWHGDDRFEPLLNDNLGALSQYLQYGGNMILSGWDILGNFTQQDEQAFAENSFPLRYLGIEQGMRSRVREFTGAEGLAGYPNLTIDREKIPANWDGLDYCWQMRPANVEVIFNFISVSEESDFHGAPCAVKKVDGQDRTITLGFPLYFMELDAAREFAVRALADLEVGIGPTAGGFPPADFHLQPNFPNPFNSSTFIPFTLPVPGSVVFTIYDIGGRKLQTINSMHTNAGRHLIHVDLNRQPSGYYFYAMKFGGHSLFGKLVLLR